MDVIISADWHVSHNPRYKGHSDDSRKTVQYVVDFAIKNRVEYFIIAGDGIDRPVRIGNYDLFFLRDVFFKLHQANIKVYYMLGNHDSNREPTVMVFDTFVNFIHRENYLTEGRIQIGQSDIVLVPYLLRGDELPDFDKKSGHRLAILHQTTSKVKFQTGNLAEDVVTTERVFAKDELDSLNADEILCGHVHRKQTCHYDNYDVIYMGATSILTFGEINSGNSFYTADFLEQKIQLQDYDIPQREWIINTGIPRKIKPNAVYKLILNEEQAKQYREIRGQFRQANSIVFIENAYRHKQQPMKRKSVVGISEMSHEERIKLWLTDRGIKRIENHLIYDRKVRDHDPAD